GFDAEAVRRIDRRGRDLDGRRAGNAVFAATVIGILVEQRLRMSPQLTVDGYGRAACLFVANGRPYTYAGPLAVTIAADADFGGRGGGGRGVRRGARLRRPWGDLARLGGRARRQGHPRNARHGPSGDLGARSRRDRGAVRPAAPAPGRR